MSGFSEEFQRDVQARAEMAEPQFPDQDQVIADMVEELTSALDVYTRDGGNLLGQEVITSWSAKAAKTLVSNPGGFLPDKMRVKGVIDISTESGKEFRLTIERTA